MKYRYVAIDRETGLKVAHTAKATSVADLVGDLKARGLTSLKVEPEQPSWLTALLEKYGINFATVTNKDIMVFTRQLAATLKAGLLLTESLDTTAENMDNHYLADIITKIRKDINAGNDFSSALSQFPKIFPRTYVAIVRSGEATGTLGRTLDQLAMYLESAEHLKDKIKTAVRYPLFVLGFALTIVLVMVLFLVPKFASLFQHAGQKLPLLTQIVLNISTFMIHSFGWMLLLVIIGAVGSWYALKLPHIQFKADQMKLRIPLIGKEILHKALMARFCRTFGFLLAGGVPLSTALDITSQVVDHRPLASSIEKVKHRVMGGSSMSLELRKHAIFPNFVAKMVYVGEKTGNTAQMLHQTADYYEHDIDHTLSRLTAILEPALIIFVGGVVLIVVLALYLPIFNMAKAIR
ncbi:MAG: type II secretion system F family protein [Candidatus Omnitrophica bacterium]|nr:type II secretion system F family protein [Candidatus Omnitrophota bacterium]